MNHKNSKKEQAVMDAFESLLWLFDRQYWDWKVFFQKEPSEDCPRSAADTFSEMKYRRISFNIYPCFWNAEKKKQFSMILHEVCHVAIGDLSNNARGIVAGGHNYTVPEIEEKTEHLTSQMEQILSLFIAGKGEAYKKAFRKYIS